MIPQGLAQLEAKAAGIFLDFVANPAQSMHPEQHEALIPDWVDSLPADARSAIASKGLLGTLNLTEKISAFEFENPIHQAMLLPAEVLMRIARALGIRCIAPHLLRVIHQEQLRELDQLLQPEDWATVLASGPLPWPSEPPQTIELIPMVKSAESKGLALLSAVMKQLPTEIGQRALLKLPPSGDWEAVDPTSALAWLPDIYRQTVEDWNPQWLMLWKISKNQERMN